MSIDRAARQSAFVSHNQPIWARSQATRAKPVDKADMELPGIGTTNRAADSATNPAGNRDAVRVSLSTSAKLAPQTPEKGVFADFDGNKIVDGADLGMLLGAYGQKGSKLDLDGDGIVNDADLELLMGAWTKPVEEPAKPKMFGDLDDNGKVDGADLGLLLGDWGKTESKMDLDGDGSVNGSDLKLLLQAWEKQGQS